jgi:hypothetical protein
VAQAIFLLRSFLGQLKGATASVIPKYATPPGKLVPGSLAERATLVTGLKSELKSTLLTLQKRGCTYDSKQASDGFVQALHSLGSVAGGGVEDAQEARGLALAADHPAKVHSDPQTTSDVHVDAAEVRQS